jgi:hypothetical protein
LAMQPALFFPGAEYSPVDAAALLCYISLAACFTWAISSVG